jgi:hypothetical protein
MRWVCLDQVARDCGLQLVRGLMAAGTRLAAAAQGIVRAGEPDGSGENTSPLLSAAQVDQAGERRVKNYWWT